MNATAATECPSCQAQGGRVFHQTPDVPVHSCVLLDNPQTAANYPRGPLRLAFCESCGFIWNAAFDPTRLEYGAGYEDQQGFSPRFRRFQTGLVRRLIQRYGVTEKDVIEIGCGKGDFLVELCETGSNRGVGIDPASDPQRQQTRGGGVRFLQEPLSDRHTELPCDLLCCRHTLEHIARTADFVRQVRRVIGGRADGRIFFEVPDTKRILVERAFWDVYYEHCSYFTAESLRRLFENAGFEVQETWADYDDQYLLLVARPAGPAGSVPSEPAGDVGTLGRLVDEFAADVQRVQQDWNRRLREFKAKGKRVAAWGSGSKCVAFLASLGLNEAVQAVVDVNPHRHNKYMPGSGQCIVPPEELRSIKPDAVIVMNPVYREEIASELEKMGLAPQILTL